MMSRYCAYAKKLAPYVYRTLAADHDDRKRPEQDVLREIRDATATLKFMRLAVLDERNANQDGIAQVLFFARVFEKGQNRSFIELSDFVHDGVGWRYLRGKQAAAARISQPEKVDIPAFETLVNSASTPST